MATLPKVPNYLKNVTKSIAFSAIDIGKEIMPDVANFANSNKEFIKQTYSAIKMPKVTTRRTIRAFQNSKIFQTLDTSFKNLKEDITTGNFYNKEREDKEFMKMMGLEDFDFESFGDDSEPQFDDSDENGISQGDLKIVDSIENSNAAAAQSTIEAIISSDENNVINSRINTAMLFNQNERLFGGLHKDLSVIGATLTSLFNFQQNIFRNIDNNSSQFQTESLKFENERNAILKEILEIQRNQYKTAAEKEREAQRNSASGSKRFSDIFSIEDYIENVVTNAKNEISLNTFGMGIEGIISMFGNNIIRDATKSIIRSSIPKATRDAMSNFNKTLDSVFANFIANISNESHGFDLISSIAKILGLNTSVRRTIDTSKYEKGQVPWDGISRRALVNVIPGYLRRIESILSGKSEIDYDYKDGKWTTLEEAKKSFDQIKQTYANAATADLIYEMTPALEARAPSDAEEQKTYKKAISEFRLFLYEHTFYPHEDANKNGVTSYSYPAFYKYYKEISEAYKDFDIVDEVDKDGNVIGKRHNKNHLRMGIAKERLNYADFENSRYRSIEADASSSIIRLHEYNDKVKVNSAGKGIAGILDIKDSFGNTIHSYLHNINKELLFWRVNFGKTGIGGGRTSTPKRRRRKTNQLPHQFTSYDDLSDMLLTEEQRKENQRQADEENSDDILSQLGIEQRDYKKDILTKIANNEIEDLSGFRNDSKAKNFLIELYRMDNEKRRQIFNETVGEGFNEEIFNKFFDKQFKDAKIKNLKDLEKAMDKAAVSDKKTYEVLKEGTSFFDKLLGSDGKGNILSTLLAGPAEIFNKALYAADSAIYEMFFKMKVKEDGTNYNGFLSMIAGESSKVLKNLKDKISNDLINPLKEKLGLKDFKDRYVDELKATGGSLWNKFSSANREVIFNPLVNRIKNRFNRNSQEADQNVAPEEVSNQDQQPQQNAKGSSGPFMGNTMLSEGELLFNDSGVSMVQKTGAFNINKPTQILNPEDSYDLLDGLGLPTAKARHSIRNAEAKENIEKRKLFSNHAKGTADFASWFKKRAPAQSEIQEIIDKAKANVPELAANATIGAGVSLLFGLVGGPLLGAAVGAGAALTKRSEALQRILFGDVGEDGERKDNGIISKKIQDLYKKYVPTIGKYSAAGLVASIITPIGPIGGAVIGASIGLLKENEDLREKLFGKLHVGDKEKEIIKKMLPNSLKGAGAGIIATLFGGPFGLLGNAAVGAAIGMMSSTDSFKNGLLGEFVNGVRSGGVLGTIKDAFKPLKDAGVEFKDRIFNAVDTNIVQPLADFVQPAIHALPQLASFIPRKINELLESRFGIGMDTIVKKILVKPLEIMLKPVSKIAGTLFKVATSPFRLLGMAGNGIRRLQMRTMNADYMTADERMEWAAEHGMAISDSDRFFASIGSEGENGFSIDQAKDLRSNLSSIIDTQDDLAKSKKNKNKEISKMLKQYKTADGHSLSPKTITKISKAINKGRPEDIPKILASNYLDGSDVGLNDDQIKAFMEGDDGLSAKVNEWLDLDARWKRSKNLSEEDKKEAKAKSDEILEKVGLKGKLDLSKRHDVEKFIKYLDVEINAKDTPQAVQDEQQQVKFLLENHENIANIADFVERILNEGIILRDSGDEYTHNLNESRKSATEKAIDAATGRADKYQEKVIKAVGEENFADMPPEQQEMARGFKRKFRPGIKHGLHLVKKAPEALQRSKRLLDVRSKVTGTLLYFEDEALNYVSTLSDEKFKKLYKFLNDKWIGEIVACQNKKITKDDLKYYLSLSNNKKGLSNRCRIVIEAGRQNDYNSIESIKNLNGTDLSVLAGKNTPEVHDAEFEPEEQPEVYDTDFEPAVENHSIGTMLLDGALGIGKAAVNGISSLFKKDESGNSIAGSAVKKIGGSIASLFGSAGEAASDAVSAAAVNDSKVDKPNDNRFLAAIGKGFGWFKRKIDGSVEPDTSDGNTKSLINERDRKQEILDKLHDAQLKASDALKDAFSGDPKEKVKKGMGWLGSLLIGGMLWKSGIIQSVFTNILKPLWTNHIKPWVKDTALPWITDTALPTIGGFITETLLPGVGGLLTSSAEMLGNIFGQVLVAFGKSLPAFLKGVFKGTLGFAGGLLDGATGNKTNAGATNNISTKDENGEERTGMSGMVNEKGQYVSWDDIREGNYKKLYNPEGVKASVSKDGSVSFKDDSFFGSSYVKTVGNAAAHAYLFPKVGKFAGNVFIKSGNAINKVARHGGLVGKVIGKASKFTGNAIGKPIKAAAGLREGTTTIGGIAKRFSTKITGSAVDSGSEAAVKSAASLIEQNAARAAAEGVETVVTVNVAEAAAEGAAKTAASATTKNKGLIAKIIDWARNAITNVLQHPRVADALKKVAGFLKIDKAATFVKEITENITKTFDDVLGKAANKVGSETLQKVAAKATVVLQLAMIIADFITGADQAEAILGVEETNLLDEFIAGLLNCLCNLIIIPAIFPGVPKLAQMIYSLFSKWTGSNYEKRVAEADKAYEEYIAKTGSTKTKEEWLKSTKSVTGWIGDKVGTGFKKLGNGIKNAAGNAVEAVKDKFKDIGSTFATNFDTAKEFAKLITGNATSDYTSSDFDWKYTKELQDIEFMNTVYNPMTPSDIKTIVTKAKECDPESLEIYTRACVLTGTDIETGGVLDKKALKTIKDTYDKVVLNRKTDQSVARAIIDTLAGKTDASSILSAAKKSYNNFKQSKIGSSLMKSTPIGRVVSSVEKIAQAITNVNEGPNKELFDSVVNGDISIFSKEYWSGINANDGTITGVFATAANGLSRITAIPILLVKKVIKSIADTIHNIGAWVNNVFEGAKEFFSDPLTYIWNKLSGKDKSKAENKYIKQDGTYASTGESASTNITATLTNNTSSSNTSKTATFLTSALNIAKNALKVKSFFGFGSGYSKQIDPRIAGIRYNANNDSEYQTIGDSGCGPTAAVNMVESIYGRGPEAVLDAANFALDKGYKETDGGTRPEFFTDYLARNGIESTTTFSKNQIAKQLSSGAPTVLMGQDPNGVSSSTPFGRTPHYVTVTGLDNKGRAVVQDPESYYDNQIYDIKDLVRTSSIGVSATGFGKHGRGESRNKMIIIGDDHVIGMYNALNAYNASTAPNVSTLSNKTDELGNIWIAKNGANYSWMTSNAFSTIDNRATGNHVVIYMVGLNDCNKNGMADKYATNINSQAKRLKTYGVNVVVVSCLPTANGARINNSNITKFNSELKAKLSSDVSYFDLANMLSGKLRYTSDKIRFDTKSYKLIYDTIYNSLTVKTVTTAKRADTKAETRAKYGTLNPEEPATTTSDTSTETDSPNWIFENGILKIKVKQTDYESGTGKYGKGEEYLSVGAYLKNVVSNSPIAKVLNSFLDMSDSSASSDTANDASNNTNYATSNSETTDTDVGTSNSTATGTFPKYELTNAQLKGVANILQHEQPDMAGWLAEASLMANLTDIAGNKNATTKNLVSKATSGWFANGKSRFNNPGQPKAGAIQAAKTVLVEGKRTLPRYVNEHDCFSDLTSVTNNGKAIPQKKDRSAYKQHVTKIKNRYGSSWTFYEFPSSGSDPFGYTSDTYRSKWGDNHYNASELLSGYGKNAYKVISKYGQAKYGRGNRSAEVWSWLKSKGYSDEAAAGILGNMDQESGVDPAKIQNGGKGPAAGIVQWENYSKRAGRWLRLSKYASNKEIDWRDLATQLEFMDKEMSQGRDVIWSKGVTYKSYSKFKAATNVRKATEDFEKTFERAGKPMMNNRYKAAEKYYKKYAGKSSDSAVEVISTSTNNSNIEANSTGLNIANNITGGNYSPIGGWLKSVVANSPIAKVLNSFLDMTSGSSSAVSSSTTDDTDTGTSYTSTTSSSSGPGTASEMVRIAQREANLTDGTNKENPKGSNYVKYNDWYHGKHTAAPWCAAFTSWTANQAGVPTSVIPRSNSSSAIYNAIKTHPKITEAQPGDLITFPYGSKAIGHIGIVESANNKKINTIEGNYSDMVKRVSHKTTESGMKLARPAYLTTSATGNNVNKPASKYTQFRNSIYGKSSTSATPAAKPIEHHVPEHSVTTNKQISKSNYATNKYGKASNSVSPEVIKAITELLLRIANNTDTLGIILKILKEKLDINISANDIADAQNGNSISEKLAAAIANSNSSALSKLNTYADTIENDSMASLITSMNAIAAE